MWKDISFGKCNQFHSSPKNIESVSEALQVSCQWQFIFLIEHKQIVSSEGFPAAKFVFLLAVTFQRRLSGINLSEPRGLENLLLNTEEMGEQVRGENVRRLWWIPRLSTTFMLYLQCQTEVHLLLKCF